MAHRINPTISDETYEALKRYAAIAGRPPTSIAGEIITQMVPTFLAVAEALENAKSDETLAIQKMRSVLLEQIVNSAVIAKEIGS